MRPIYMIFFLLSFPVFANQMNNKTPVPTVEAAQRSGLYEGVELTPTPPKPAQEQQEDRLKQEHPEEYQRGGEGQRSPRAGKP